MKLASIIIPAYNEENYLKSTLESIKSQNYKEIETIVVCNGCTDNTEKIAREYSNKVIIIKEKNVSKSRNLGAQEAKGDFLIFLDADTLLFQEVISKISDQLEKGHFYGTVAGKSELKGLSPFISLKTKEIINKFYPWSNGIIFCNKEDFIKTKGFNPNLKFGELRPFYNQIKQYSKYKKLNTTYVVTSQRRIKNWGLKKVIGFWATQKQEYKAIR